MARITADDCLKKIPNRFEMTLAAATRARQLSLGAEPLIPLKSNSKDKPTVIALREIAAGAVGLEILEKRNT